MFYQSRFTLLARNLKQTWILLGKITRREPSKNVPHFFTDNGVEIYDKSKIANRLNEYFVNIGTRLAAQIPTTASSFSEFMTNSYINSLCF